MTGTMPDPQHAVGEHPSGGVRIVPVRSRRDRRAFIDLPYRLYTNDARWIAPLRIAQKALLDVARHPFYKTADAEMFLAYRNGRAVGRVMAILNRIHNEFHQEQAGFFGFFDSEDDTGAVASLLAAARDWLRKRGATLIRGPVSPSTNYECGLLVEGFEYEPAVMMPYNRPYYGKLIEQCGLKKAMDLYAFYVDVNTIIMSDKLSRVADRARQKTGLSVRKVNLKNFSSEVQSIRKVYNEAWNRNWGFVPVNDEEFDHLAKDLKQIVDADIVYIAEARTGLSDKPAPVGFILAVPDVNQALKRIRGRLFPFGLLKLLWYSRRITALRVITLGVVKEYQSLGVAAVFYDEVYRSGRSKGYLTAEMGWVLENNVMMNRAAEMLGGRRVKTFRIYEAPL
jgi:hypothetical protein